MSGFMMMSMNNQRIVSAAPAPPPSAAFVTSGLVTYLDAAPSGVYPTKYEGVGYDNSGVWRDQVGSSDITLANSPPYDSSTNGGQFTFNLNGSGGYSAASQCGTGAVGSAINTSEMTVEVWYNSPPGFSGAPTVPIICSNLDSTNNAWMIKQTAPGSLAWNRLIPSYQYNGAFTNGGGNFSLSANVWYQITFRKTGGNMYASYYNGSSYTSTTSWPYSYPNSSPEALYLMTYDAAAAYRGGKLAIVRIYNTALSNADLLTNYNATKARFGLT